MNYQERMMIALNSIPIAERSMNDAEIAHDSWCKIYKDKPCNCEPDITISAGGKTYTVDLEGRTRTR